MIPSKICEKHISSYYVTTFKWFQNQIIGTLIKPKTFEKTDFATSKMGKRLDCQSFIGTIQHAYKLDSIRQQMNQC